MFTTNLFFKWTLIAIMLYFPNKHNQNTPDMIFVQGGEFIMGSDKYKTSHKVSVDDFYLSKYEVTIAQYKEFLDATGYIPRVERMTNNTVEIRDSIYQDERIYKQHVNWYADAVGRKRSEQTFEYYPISYILWTEAIAYCNWLSKKTGEIYRLPTEAEWEYAAKGGVHWEDEFIYAGSNIVTDVSWDAASFGYKRSIHPIGKKKANQLGFYDMSGNVAEWCLDNYQDNYYLQTTYKNPLCKDSTHNKNGTNLNSRVAKGGSFTYGEEFSEVAARCSEIYDIPSCRVGFRIVREVKK